MHVHLNLSKWSSIQRHIWSSVNPREWTLRLSLSHSTGSHLLPSSSSRHWGLPTEKSPHLHPSNYTPENVHYLQKSVVSTSVSHRVSQTNLYTTQLLPRFFAPIRSLDIVDAICHCQSLSADFGQSKLADFTENHVAYDWHGLCFLV